MNSYQIIGSNINYTLSPLIYQYLGKMYNIELNYQITDVSEINIDLLSKTMGGNITIPFKHKAFELLADNKTDVNDYLAFRDKSINCYKCVDDKISFTSTDQYGLIMTLRKNNYHSSASKHLIRGDGATAMMLYNTLVNDFGFSTSNIFLISRKNHQPNAQTQIIHIDKLMEFNFTDFYLYNATPIGNVNDSLNSPFPVSFLKGAKSVFDANYLPLYNQLHKDALTCNVKYISGLPMLIYQGIKSFEFWTDIDASTCYEKLYRNLLVNISNRLVVCAMPFAGKSTLHTKYKSISIDLDKEVGKFLKMPIANYIETNGLEKFRQCECEVLTQKLSENNNKMILLGGGTLTNPKARELLKNELVVYMHVNISELKKRFTQTRANIKTKKQLEKIYNERENLYMNLGQITVTGKGLEDLINEYYNY